ncbi:MAG: hypothetical protein KAS04_02100, partial [Candidatus Aenigmarchaeota archaeon]|nr:hypothetical protein [Candidatus Aenigmarchaeota archaeon]
MSYLFSLFMFNVLIFFANKLPLRDIYGFSKFFVIISAFVITFQGIFYPLGTTALFGFLPFTTEGIVFGIAISLRMFCILFSLSLLMLTTKQKDI